MNLLKDFRIYDLVVIALMAALGIAVKIIVTPLAHLISGPLNMPGGALAGGFYMFWIVLAGALVGKRGAATLTALVQALMVLVVGTIGSHGIMSMVTYTLPGLMVDLVFLLLRRPIKDKMDFFIGGMIANMTGTFLTGMVFFRLPLVTLVMIVASGMLSGGLGGLIAYGTYKGVKGMTGTMEAEKSPPKKRPIAWLILLACVLIGGLIYFLGGFQKEDTGDQAQVFALETDIQDFSLQTIQPLLVTGDVTCGGYIEDHLGDEDFQVLESQSGQVMAIEWPSLLETLGVRSRDSQLYLIAHDGFMVAMDTATLNQAYLAYDSDLGWYFVSDKHPVNAGIKGIEEVVLVSQEPLEDFNVIKEGENHFYSKGQLRMMMDTRLQVLDGIAQQGDLSVDVMKIKSVIPLSQWVDQGDSLMVATESGDQIYVYDQSGYLEFSQDSIRYIEGDLQIVYQDVVGIFLNPPPASIKDHVADAQYYLDKGVPVLSLFVDGFSYVQYEDMIKDDHEDYIDSLQGVQAASVGYKPVTNVGFATMVTGVDPSIHGVHDRSYRQVGVKTLFDYCEDQGISHGLIEGDIEILQLETDTYLNTDNNDNGTRDDEIQETALKTIDQYAYVMVHYHSVDDYGHTYGPDGIETQETLRRIDGYIEALVAQWPGKVILLADHGMHADETGGDHGAFRIEDFVVPYVIFDGGGYEP